jgi:two-component system sensor histidine kinase YesM
MERVVDEQRDKRKTELRALQNQINPHFLYNSLDSIVWLAEHERSEDVVTTVIALARFFRISISKGATFILVREEIDHVKNYLTIQSIRYVDKFSYAFDIDERMMTMKVMKLILQPLVENAIHHGLVEDDGFIEIKGRLENGWMLFDVRNTGYGLTESRIAEIHDHLDGRDGSGSGFGVGLRNVQQRLKLYYGESAGLRFSGQPDEDTVVTVRIPVGPGAAP